MTVQSEELPPQRLHYLRESTAPDYPEPFYQKYQPNVPIAIDLGSANVRVGLTNSENPNNVFPTLVAKHRDRKLSNAWTLVGNDIFREAHHYSTLRSNAKSPYDGPLVTNWEYVESILDYLLEHLSVTSKNGKLNNPIVMTEPVACPIAQRRNMYEILFEAYRAPKVAMGIDSLFAYHANTEKSSGLVVSVGNEATHIIPVLEGRGVLLQCRRIDWGASLGLQHLQKMLALKYPYFPTRLSSTHTSHILEDHAYVLRNYADELAGFLDMDNLNQTDVVIQVPVEILPEKSKKSDEELARQTERRKEQGRRLQEQAQKKRLEKLVQKEQEYEYYTQLKTEISRMNKGDADRRVQSEDFDDVADLNKYMDSLEKALKKARTQDLDDGEEEQNDPELAWPLAEVPDAELSEDQIKEKRKQKLMKSSYEARLRAKEAKLKEEEEKIQYEKHQEALRAKDLDAWCTDKRIELAQLISVFKKRAGLMEAMKDRKSMAAQKRMKTIADLANDLTASTTAQSRKRRRNINVTIDNDPNDTFGTNDDDWNAYRDISDRNLEEEQEDTNNEILRVEALLLQFDPNFHHEDTFAVSETFDWRGLVLHKFIHGPRQSLSLAMQAEGHDPDELLNHPEIIRRNHQLHVNVERIRVPEIYFQPHIAGLDLAGIPEVIQNMLCRNFDGNFIDGQLLSLIKNIFVTGGGSLLPNFPERLASELTSFLPTGAPLKVYRASDPILDPWRGMQKWANSEESANGYVSRAEYEEMGAEYIKEHGLGNVSLLDM